MNVFVSSVAFYMNVFVSHVYCLIESLVSILRYKDRYYNQKPVSNYYQKPTIFLCKRLHKTTPYFLLYKIFSSKKKALSLYNICISNLSKLRVERTRKSLARNSWVLNNFSYITNTQRITTSDSKINKKHERKNASFFCKRTTFALQLYSIYIATVLHLHCKCSPFEKQKDN